MGSLSAMNSINRVLEKHGAEIEAEYLEQVPPAFRDSIESVALENNLYSIQVSWKLADGTSLPGPEIDIDTLAGLYPDCDVGY